jgi:hypothetical protein
MPCTPVTINPPIGPSGPSIPGFGIPSFLNLGNINPFPAGFPEDLLDILNTLQLLIPPGILMPTLNLNFGKDIFDAIMKLLDQFMPFLMLYKFFLPILNMILCILEVICAIPNPFKLIPAIIKLFTQCIPAFLLLFPFLALIIMIISLIILLIALIEYIINKVLELVLLLIRNILALVNAFQQFNVNSVLAIAHKIGASLCIFQNLFVLLAIFAIIIQIIKDILGLAFALPPCDDSNPTGCCTTDVCPSIAKEPFTLSGGTFQYLNEVDLQVPTTLPSPYNNFNSVIRQESWQLYDVNQPVKDQFFNIVNAFDVTPDPSSYSAPYFKPVFFPTDSNYTGDTSPNQAAYTVNLRLFYVPSFWGRPGASRYIRINQCIVLSAPTQNLLNYNNSEVTQTNGVLSLAGGLAYEDDGKTIITGFSADGITPSSKQGTLNNLIHQPPRMSASPTLSPSDGYTFGHTEYTFTPNPAILMSKNLITLGCIPDVSIAKAFVNTNLAGDVAVKTAELQNLLNSTTFPNPTATQACLTSALNVLRGNLTTLGVAEFQSTATACLTSLQNDCTTSLTSLIGLGFDPCKSSFTAFPLTQFTSKPVTIQVSIAESNGISLTQGLSSTVADTLASGIKAYPTFGEVSDFTFDGYQYFTAEITSQFPGQGSVSVAFNDNIFCTNDVVNSNRTLQNVDYQFIYTPTQGSNVVAVGDKSQGAPVRDDGDLTEES